KEEILSSRAMPPERQPRTSRNGRPQRRYLARRLEILRAAGRQFRSRGFMKTGMRDIAEAAELSPANLYNYFEGKHEILFFCQDSSLDRMLAALTWSVQWFRPDGPMTAEEIAESLADYLIRGLLTKANSLRQFGRREKTGRVARKDISENMGNRAAVA